MTIRHAASRAATATTVTAPRRVVGAGAGSRGTPETSSSSRESPDPSRISAKDIKLARSIIRAAIHGHAPHWKRLGWKAQYDRGGLDPESQHPAEYLTREAIEYDPTTRQKKGGDGWKPLPQGFKERQFRNQTTSQIQKKYGLQKSQGVLASPDKPKSFSTFSRLEREDKVFGTNDDISGMEEEDEDLSDLDTLREEARDELPLPSPLTYKSSAGRGLSSTHRDLKIGDFVQVRQGTTPRTYIFLGENTYTLPGRGRKVLLHGHGNALATCRYDDILFRMPGVVSEQIAKRATAMLHLSPPEYIEGLQEQDDAMSAGSEIPEGDDGDGNTVAESSKKEEQPTTEIRSQASTADEEEELLWQRLGIEYESPRWQEAFDAKLAVGKALREADREQEAAKRVILQKGAKSLWKTFRDMRNTGSKNEDVYITTQEAYDALFSGEDAEAEAEPSKKRKGKERAWFSSDMYRAQQEMKQSHRLFALHNYFFLESEQFVTDPLNFFSTNSFRLRTNAEIENLHTVRAWIREEARINRSEATELSDSTNYQSVIGRFKDRVQDIVKAGRQGQNSATSTPWSDEEKEIIQFLLHALDMRKTMQVNPFQASAAVLVKSIRSAAEQQDHGIADTGEGDNTIPEMFLYRTSIVEFLKSIRVFKDWENLTVRARELNLQKWTEELATPSSSGLSGTSVVSDPHDDQRHDFGSLPVYTIDDISASELDDGISITSNNDTTPPSYWLHMHIADPTSTLAPNDTLALQARERQSSIYFPEMTWPMIPFDTIKKQGWSLGDMSIDGNGGKGPKGGQKVLTFSAKVDENGEILEKMVRPGWIQNVKTTTYDKVDEVLGAKKEIGSAESDTSIGNDRILSWPSIHGQYRSPGDKTNDTARPRELSELPSSAAEDLANLKKVTAALLRRRVSNSALQWNTGNERQRGLTIHPRPLLPHFTIPSSPLPEEVSPQLDLYLSSDDTKQSSSVNGSPAQMIVSECMILAARIAGSHLSSYTSTVAVPYRGQEPPLSPNPQDLQDILDVRDKSTGLIDPSEIFKRSITLQTANFSLDPIGHWPMGIQGGIGGGYLRATSPLRRYSDLLVHWQLKSTLLRNKTDRPPFSIEEVKSMITFMENTTRLRTRTERRSRLFWRLYLISSKLKQLRADSSSDPFAANLLLDPKGLTAVVGDTRRDDRSHRNLSFVKIEELDGLPATMLSDPRRSYAGAVKVKIEGIVLDEFSKMFVRPIEECGS